MILLAGAAGGVAGAAIGVIIAIIDHAISHEDIQETVRKEIPVNDDFRYKILKAKKNSVDVGIFGKQNNLIKKVEICSDEGVSPEVQQSVGMTYTL